MENDSIFGHKLGQHLVQGPVGDPVVSKYIASGLNREAVTLAVSKYGDDPTKVHPDLYGII